MMRFPPAYARALLFGVARAAGKSVHAAGKTGTDHFEGDNSTNIRNQKDEVFA